MNLKTTHYGQELETPEITLLFGNKEAQWSSLRAAYPHYEFVRLKQIHSDAIVESTDPLLDPPVIADAHFTSRVRLALCVITADCMPVFFYDPVRRAVAGIHAGWRGVASRIVPKTLLQLQTEGSEMRDLRVFIGPHIQRSSFEVENDVRDLILSSLGPLSPSERNSYIDVLESSKVRVDLGAVVRAQLQQHHILAEHIQTFPADTMTDPQYHSYRRDRDKSGRQISFICLNELPA
ncbi:MAG: peptidoglycan editing factor PgeF [Bdellovibrio sp.]